MPLYQKSEKQELTPWTVTTNMAGVSVSPEDRVCGSPKLGDMIAVNAKNPRDKWLVSKSFFEENYIPAVDSPDPSAALLKEQSLQWSMELIARVAAHQSKSLVDTTTDFIAAMNKLLKAE
jgi:hypothetical protein